MVCNEQPLCELPQVRQPLLSDFQSKLPSTVLILISDHNAVIVCWPSITCHDSTVLRVKFVYLGLIFGEVCIT